MAEQVPTSADQFIEQQLDERIARVEQQFQADAICLVGQLLYRIDDFVWTMVEDLKQRRADDPRERLVVLWMDYYSRLGPIDPQIENRTGRLIPATGYLKRWELFVERDKAGDLTDAELAVMINSFDQAELHAYREAAKYAVALLEQWLVNYKFKDWAETDTRKIPVTPEMRRDRAVKIAEELGNTDRWHSHGYGISKDELIRIIGLKIDDLDRDSQRCTLVRQYDRLLSDYMGKGGLIGIMQTVGSFVPTIRAA